MSTTSTGVATSLATAHQTKELKPGFGVLVEGLDFAQGATKESRHLVDELVKKVNIFAITPTTSMTLFTDAFAAVRSSRHSEEQSER